MIQIQDMTDMLHAKDREMQLQRTCKKRRAKDTTLAVWRHRATIQLLLTNVDDFFSFFVHGVSRVAFQRIQRRLATQWNVVEIMSSCVEKSRRISSSQASSQGLQHDMESPF
jgi:hypothetical protein